VIQSNIAENEHQKLQNAFKELGIEFEEVFIIPFSGEIPKFTIDKKTNIYYGAISFINNIIEKYDPVGVFFNETTFSMENYMRKWGENMLSYGAKSTTLGEFCKENHSDEELFFIRPDADDKSFVGDVRKFEDIKNWNNNLQKCDNVQLNENTKIIVGEAYNIKYEWG
jgi:predicted  nucleic acid-binding Zn ribbon protein